MSGNKSRNIPPRKGHLPTGDFIALGSKPGGPKLSLRHSADDSKQGLSKSGIGGASSLGPPPSKKPRQAPSSEASGGLFSDPIRVQPPPSSGAKGTTSAAIKGAHSSHGTGHAAATTPSPSVIEVRPGDLLPAIAEAKSSGSEAKVTKILAGAMRQLKHSRLKPDQKLNHDLISLVKEDAQMFSNPAVIEVLISVLRREPSVIFKAKSNTSVYILACQILLLALQHSYDWPESIGKVYIEDSIGDRVWVDLEPCKKLVDNICITFQTKQPPGQGGEGSSKPSAESAGPSGQGGGGGGSGGGGGGGGGGGREKDEEEGLSLDGVDVEPRFSLATCKSLKAHILQLVSEAFGRHAHPPDSMSRNLLKFLTTVAGYPEVRIIVAQKIESWIQNPKLGKHCQDLLMTVATNCNTHQAEDLRVIEALLAVRLKTKLFSNQFVACIRELISSHPSNLETVLRGVVNNELGQLRSPSNMALLSMMLHSWPEEAPKLLGTVFQEFLARKEDYLRALRGFLREIVRQVRNEFNFYSFAWSLLQKREQTEFQQMDQQHKERMALSISDLVACSCMLMANMLIREAYNGYVKGEKAMVAQLQEFFTTLGVIQRDAVWWIHTIVPEVYRPQPQDYRLCLRKVLFLEGAEVYCSRDNWPPETDRNLILHLMGEACLKEDTLMRVLVVGLKREFPLSPADALDIADKLVARAANAHTDDIPRLPTVERRELFNIIFEITAYRPPPNIHLPEDYQPPSLAISKLYWKGWILLLVLSAFNPKTIGSLGWSEYPSLKGMMEMVMTSNYAFPPSMALAVLDDGTVENRDSATMREMQVSRAEKESILEYENHLAASSTQPTTITESNSFLLNQVTLLQPKGPVRRLPTTVIDLIKTVNRSLKLGQLLCRCRSPDFLLDVIRRQGTVESMKWLTELMESSHSSLEVLPIPCLCEFLMASYKDQGGGGMTEMETDVSSHRAHYKRRKTAHEKVHERHKQLVNQLHSLLVGPQATAEKTSEVMEYFFEKLTGSNLTPRRLALKSLKYILSKGMAQKPESDLSDTEDEDYAHSEKEDEWLMKKLPSLPHFPAILPKISHLLLQACLVETNLKSLLSFLLFLTSHIPRDLVFEFSIGISQIVVDRFSIIKKVFQPRWNCGERRMRKGADVMLGSLLSMLRGSMEMAIQSQRMPQISGSQDFLVVGFPSGKKAIFHSALIHATLLLLTCPPPSQSADFDFLMELWFPPGGQYPEAYTVENKEETPLITKAVLPHMLCSENEGVLGLCLKCAEPAQLCASVEQFGIPVTNMEQIMRHLDSLCEAEKSDKLEEVIDKPFQLAQFIEVQLMRGVSSGRAFLALVRKVGNLPEEPVASIPDILGKKEAQKMDMLPVPPSTSEAVDVPQLSGEKMEQLLLQFFAPSVARANIPPEEVKKLISDIEQGLKKLIQSAASRSGGNTQHTTLNTHISVLIATLHKLVTSGSARVRRQFLEGMMKQTFAITLLRLITKIQQIQKNEDQSTGLFKATVKHIVGTLASLKAGKSKQFPRLQAAVKSCAKQLSLKESPERENNSEKVAKVARDCAAGIREEPDLFSKEQAMMIGDICRLVGVEKQSTQVEVVLSSLVQQSISSGKERECMDLIQKLEWRCRPIAPHFCPEVFQSPPQAPPGGIEGSGGESAAMRDAGYVSSSHLPVVASLDMSGLKVDLLELLDPEILSVNPEFMKREVFNRPEESEELGGVLMGRQQLLPASSYLMARLVHESSWNTLHRAITALLVTDNLDHGVSPTAVLDFLWACLHKPVLWQGRVKKEAVENSNLSLGIDDSELDLTPMQLKCVLNYILTEASLYLDTKELKLNSFGKPNPEVSPECKTVLHSRLPLLMSCCHGNKKAMARIVKHLKTHDRFPSLNLQLLLQLYHIDERVLLLGGLGDNNHLMSISTFVSSIPCKLDTELHHLVSAMCDAKPGLESIEKMTSAALICRKIAFRHPILFIRQLPLLGWLLQGRAYLNPSEFRNRNHKHVFRNALFLLDLLQPLVFEDNQGIALETCLEPFFDFFQNQCLATKKHQTIVLRFSEFLVQYAQHSRMKAAAIIYRHLNLLQSLADNYSAKKSSLRSLVECFPKHLEGPSESQTTAGPPLGAQMMVVPPSLTAHNLTHEQVMPFLRKLEQGQLREDVLKVLQDLDETSLHSVEILKHFVPELCRIIRDPEPTSCQLAHNLLLRHVKETPSAMDNLLPAYMACLESHDHSVVMGTVVVVPDLVLLCQTRGACLLLWKLFQLATRFFYDCTPDLLRAVEACTRHTFQ